MGNLDVQFCSEIQVFGVLQNQIGLHCQNRLQEIVNSLEGILALPEQPADVKCIDDGIVDEMILVEPLFDIQIVMIFHDGLQVIQNGLEPSTGVFSLNLLVELQEYLELSFDTFVDFKGCSLVILEHNIETYNLKLNQ